MPIGSYALTESIVHALCQQKPDTVLDVGIGMGFYGAAVRQWLDMGVKPYRTHLDGVEAHLRYKNPCWQLYTQVYSMPVETFLFRYAEKRYDAILFSDVIEHFEFAAGLSVLESLKSILRPGGILLVGTPAIFVEQGAVYNNEFERHRSLWSERDFEEQGFTILRSGKPCAYGHQMILARFTNSATTAPE